MNRILSKMGLSLAALSLASVAYAQRPKVILISLDGATPRLIEQFSQSGDIAPGVGLRRLQAVGIRANRNTTVSPSLTAVAHIAIATGSSAAVNDITANTFHLIASPFLNNISGFGAPIGGYSFSPLGELLSPTAEPLWVGLRAQGRSVSTATWPGGDGVDVRVPGLVGSPIIQSAPRRTVNYTVPFGAFGGVGAVGFTLTGADFSAAPTSTVTGLTAAGRTSFSPVRQKTTPLENFTVGGVAYQIQVAALDTTNDSLVNYDTLVFFNQNEGITAGAFPLPRTGPAYVRASDNRSSLFYLEGSSNRAGVAFYVSNLAPDLSLIRLARYSANAIPRNAPVIPDVDDANGNVGFWAPQPDFRIPERLGPGFTSAYPDLELEAIYLDQIRLFTDYQLRLALRAIARSPDVDLLMVYFEEPDGPSHQFLLTDPRQASDFTNPNSIGAGQDAAKVARYNQYLAAAYRAVNEAVDTLINTVGVDAQGRPSRNIIVTSDHGFEPFHTAVNLNALFAANGIDTNLVRAVTSGPAVNIYISLAGREPNGVVSKTQYLDLQTRVVNVLRAFADTNPTYAPGGVPVFDKVYRRPADLNDPAFGRATSQFIGQDGGDVYALLRPGYNFDGIQTPVVRRLGDAQTGTPILSVPNFYGAHGYDPELPNLSAIFYAAGPNIGNTTFTGIRNIDIAPTITTLMGLTPAPTTEGRAMNLTSAPLALVRAVSRKTHGEAGDFDLPLALAGGTVESRRSGAGGTHTLVFTFNNNVTQATATVSAGVGAVASTTLNGSEVIVTLSNVADRQNVTVTLSGVTDVWGGTAAPSLTLGALLGDVNGDRTVTQADVELSKALSSPGIVGGATFRADLNGSGLVNSTDVAQTKSRLGQSL